MLIRHRGAQPSVHRSAYIAPNATLVGDVQVGPQARIMYGAVLDAEGSQIVVGQACVVAENAVLRATATGSRPYPVTLGDHVFVGPHATLLGCHVERCCYLATGVTVLHAARLGAGASVAVGALVHARTVLPPECFIAPMSVAIGDPARLFTVDRADEIAEAIREVAFASVAFGVDTAWEDRIRRYEEIAEVRVAEFGAHVNDTVL
jgi:carbonic anhydrase/acetyltransferase-like protein (isoleucine patch superfamily)